jgi:hypothetical protein
MVVIAKNVTYLKETIAFTQRVLYPTAHNALGSKYV